jgi:hypothetical protein
MTSHRFLDGRHAPSNKRRLQSFTSRCVPPTEYPSSTPGSSLQQQTEAVAQVKVNTQCSHRYQQRRKMTTWIMGPKQKKENARNKKFNGGSVFTSFSCFRSTPARVPWGRDGFSKLALDRVLLLSVPSVIKYRETYEGRRLWRQRCWSMDRKDASQIY